MASDPVLADRVRAVLVGRPDVEERRMVGGRSFIVGGHLCVGVSGSSLLVRVGPGDYQRRLAEPHVRPLELGGKHPVGYVLVAPAGCQSDEDLKEWIGRGLAFVTSLPRPRSA